MTLPEALKELRSHPKFPSLPYAEQSELTMRAAAKYAPQYESWQNASPEERRNFIMQVAMSPPVLEDKDVQQKVEGLSQAARNGDEDSLKQMSNFLIRRRVYTQSILANLIDEKLVSPYLERNFEDAGRTEMLQNFELVNLERDDEIKVADFFSTMVSQEKDVARRTKIWSFLAGSGAALGETLLMYGIGAGFSPATARGLGALFVKPFQIAQAASKTHAVGRLAFLGANISQAAAGGVLGVGRETLLASMNDVVEDPSWQEIVANSKQYFNQYFVGDLLANLATEIVFPQAKFFLKNFKGWGQSKQILKKIPKDQLEGLIKQVARMEDINPAMFPDLAPEALRNAQAKKDAFQVFRRIAKADPATMPREMLDLAAGLHGYGTKTLDDGAFEVFSAYDDMGKTIGRFSQVEDASKAITEDIRIRQNATSKSLVDTEVRGKGYDVLRLRRVIQEKASLGNKQNVDLLTSILAPTDGKFNPRAIRDFAKGYLGSMDAGQPITGKLTAETMQKSGRDYIQLRYDGGEIATIRRGPTTGGEELKSVGKIIDSLNKIADDAGLAGSKRLTSEVYSKQLKKQSIFTLGWMDNTARERLGGKIVKIKNGTGPETFRFTPLSGDASKSLEFSSLEEAGNFVLRKSVDFDDVSFYLAREEGLTLAERTNGGLKVTDGNNRTVWEGDSLEEFLVEHPELMPKAPGRLGPSVAIAADGMAQVEYVDRAVVGSYESILEHLNGFFSKKKVEKIPLGPKGVQASFVKGTRNTSFELEIPEIGWRGTFEALDDAKAFVAGGIEKFDKLETIAIAKGYRLDMFGGDFFLHSTDGKAFKAESIEEVKRFLADSANIPEWAPELSPLGEEVFQPAKPPDSNFFKRPFERRQFRRLKSQREGWDTISRYFKPTETVFEEADFHGAPKEYLQLFREGEAARRAMIGRGQKIGRVIYTIGSDGKKPFTEGALQNIQRLLETPKAKWTQRIAELNLEPKHVRAAERFRELLGETSEEGFAYQFSIRPEKFLQEYTPYMRKWISENPDKLDGPMEGVLKRMFRGEPPNDLVAFFKYDRTAENLVNAVRERNPIRLLLKYAELGNRDLFLAPVYKKMKALTDLQNIGSKDVNAQLRMTAYVQDIMGIPSMDSQEMKRVTQKGIMKIFGLNETEARSWIQTLRVAVYGATLAGRAWLPARNMHQIWTMAAPLIGPKHIRAGIKRVLHDKNGVLFDTYRAKGIIASNQPVFGGEIFNRNRLLDRIVQKGMTWYRNSDDLNRAITAAGAEDRWAEAITKYKRGGIGEKEFFDLAGLNNFDDTRKEFFSNLIREGKWNEARDTYAATMVDRTQIPYRSGMGPEAFRKITGKLFGQFGTYPTFYVDNIRRMLKYGSLSDKIAFGTTWIGNSMLIYNAWKELGIDEDAFQWWNPMFFAGGPLFDLAIDLIQAPTALAGSYKGRQAAAEAFGLKRKNGKLVWNLGQSEAVKLLIPGSLAFRRFQPAIEALGKNDLYGFFGHIASAPLSSE